MPTERPVTPSRSSDTASTVLSTVVLISAILAVRLLYSRRTVRESIPFEPAPPDITGWPSRHAPARAPRLTLVTPRGHVSRLGSRRHPAKAHLTTRLTPSPREGTSTPRGHIPRRRRFGAGPRLLAAAPAATPPRPLRARRGGDGSAADRVHAAVDVHDLAGGAREPVGQQRDAGLAAGSGSATSQPSGAWRARLSSNSSKPGMLLAAIVRIGPAATRLTRTPCLPEVAGEVARGRLEGRPSRRPSSRTSATPPWRRSRGRRRSRRSLHQRQAAIGERLQRVGGDVHARWRRPPTRC